MSWIRGVWLSFRGISMDLSKLFNAKYTLHQTSHFRCGLETRP